MKGAPLGYTDESKQGEYLAQWRSVISWSWHKLCIKLQVVSSLQSPAKHLYNKCHTFDLHRYSVSAIWLATKTQYYA